MNPTARRWRLLLLAYPRDYRAAHGEEILTTVLDGTAPGRRFLAPREVVGLLVGGAARRASVAAATHPGRLWTEGVHLGVLLLVLANLGAALEQTWAPWWIALQALTAVAVARRWTTVALGALVLSALQVSRPLLLAGTGLNGVVPFLGPAYGDWAMLARWVVPIVGMAVLALIGRDLLVRPRRRSLWWLLLPTVLGAGMLAGGDLVDAVVILLRLGVEVVAVVGAVVLAVRAADPRPAVALGVFLLPGLAMLADERTSLTHRLWAVSLAVLLAMVALAHRAALRHQAPT